MIGESRLSKERVRDITTGIDASTSDGKMTLGDFTIHLRKNGGKELAVTFDPNFSDAENDVKIFIANNYEEDSVLVRQPASSGYDLEDLVWSEEVVRLNPLNEIEEAWGLCFKNLTPDTLWVENKVFEGAKRIITFTGDSGFGMHGGNLDIPVPDGALTKDNTLKFSGEMADYSLSDTEYAYQNDKIARMFFPPDSSYTKCYRIFWSIDAYRVGYTLRIRNRSTGNVLRIEGTMTSKSPNGESLLINEKK